MSEVITGLISFLVIFGFLIGVRLLIIWAFAKSLKTKRKAFWWMFFFTIPVGAIITLLLDIKDNTAREETDND